MKRKEKVWTAIFLQEFQHIPITAGSSVVKKEWIKYWNSLPEQFDEVILAIDPATSEKELSDFTWISVVGRLQDKIYSIFSEWVKLSPVKLFEHIKNLNKIYKPNIIIYEQNKEVKLFQDLKLAWLPLSGVWAHKDKWTRLLEVAWLLEFGDVFFSKKDEDLIYQLTHFPDVEHDDILDAFVYNLLYIQQWGGLRISSL